ncbi:unnamed protein product [Trichobilharzia szidati]|nr:unnamed protein product [Trichobilharzia szidati]
MDISLEQMERYVPPINPATYSILSVLLLAIGAFFMACFSFPWLWNTVSPTVGWNLCLGNYVGGGSAFFGRLFSLQLFFPFNILYYFYGNHKQNTYFYRLNFSFLGIVIFVVEHIEKKVRGLITNNTGRCNNPKEV